MNQDLDTIEEKLKEKDAEEKKVKHKVSGKSVFEIQEIIKEKSKKGYVQQDVGPPGSIPRN